MITPQAEEYLEAIYRLGEQETPVSLTALAAQLELSAPSVNEMVRRLEEQEWVSYTPYKGVQLSEKGMCLALAVLRRHRLWERFLTDMLGLSWDLVHEEACRLEHAASDVITERLADLLDQPDRCPHGKPMPAAGCQPASLPQAIPLTLLPIDHQAQVIYVAREEPELLRHLETLGLLPDTKVVVEQAAPFDGPLTVRVNAQPQVIGYNVASTVYVTDISTGDTP
jgi:DtxR family Mn-dependent transcriptional regulator